MSSIETMGRGQVSTLRTERARAGALRPAREPQQIHARIGNSPQLFERAWQWSITLKA